MKKIMVIGDIQTYHKNKAYESGKNIIDVTIEALEWAYGIARDQGIEQVFLLGDIFEHSKPNYKVFNRMVKFFQGQAVETNTITGNHDDPEGGLVSSIKKDSHVLHALALACDNFYILDGYTVDTSVGIVVGLPFYRHEEHFKDALKVMLDMQVNPDTTILLMHQDTISSVPGSTIKEDDDIFGEFMYVFNGHIINKSQHGNFYNCGNFLQQKGTDKGSGPNGIYIVGEEVEFIPHEGFPEFVDYYQDEDVRDEDVGNYIIRKERPTYEVQVEEDFDDTVEEGRLDLFNWYVETISGGLPEGVGVEFGYLLLGIPDAVAKSTKVIKYESITIEGFRSWVDPVTYDFRTNKIQYIQAPKGSGKTSIFEALIWAECGTPIREGSKVDDVVSEPWIREMGRDWRGTRVMVVKYVDGIKYTVIRHINFKGDTNGLRGKDSFVIYKNESIVTAEDLGVEDEEFNTKTQKTNSWLKFNGFTMDMILNTVYFSPDKCRLISAKEAEKRKILEPLLGVVWVDDLKELAKEEIEEVSEKYDTSINVKSDINNRLASLSVRLKSEEAKLSKFEEDKQVKVEELKSKIDTNDNLLQDIIKEIEVYEQQLQNLVIKEIDISSEKEKFVSAKDRKYDLQEQVKSAKRKLVNCDEYYPEKSVKFLQVKDDLARQKYQVFTSVSKQKEVCRELGRLYNNIVLKKSEYDHIGDNCPTCETVLKKGHDILVNRDRIKDVLDRVTKEYAKLEDEQKERELQIVSLEEGLKIFEVYEEGYERDFKEECAKVLEGLEANVIICHKAVEDYKQEYEEIARAYNTALLLYDSQDKLCSDKESIVANILGAKEDKGRFIGILTTQRDQLGIEQKSKPDKSDSIKIEKEITAIKKESKIHDKKTKILTHRLEALRYVTSRICGVKGLKKFIINLKLGRINRYASEYAAEIGTSFRFFVDDSNKFECSLMIQGRERLASNASDGQLVIANLLLAKSLGRLWRDRVDIDLQLFDEPYSQLDVDTIHQVSRIFLKDREKINTHVITHSPVMDMFYADVLRIEGGETMPSRLIK